MTIEYNDGSKVLPKGSFKISPSQLSKFFDATTEWYRSMLLDEVFFTSSTATELGNCVHYLAELYIKDPSSVNFKEINEYITKIKNPEIEKDTISFQYPIMFNALRNNFLSTYSHITTAETEKYVYTEIFPGIYAAGSIDMYNPNENGGTITDWKTMGSLDKARLPASFPRQYWFQQMTYAWILRQQGRPVSQCKLVYITRNNTGRFNDKGKPLKDYPSQTHVLTEPVTDESMQIIEGVLKVVAESVLLWNSNPEYRHILAQDDRLRAPKKPKLFKKD